MKFRGRIAESLYIRKFYQLIATISKIGKICILRLTLGERRSFFHEIFEVYISVYSPKPTRIFPPPLQVKYFSLPQCAKIYSSYTFPFFQFQYVNILFLRRRQGLLHYFWPVDCWWRTSCMGRAGPGTSTWRFSSVTKLCFRSGSNYSGSGFFRKFPIRSLLKTT